jgi:hypothetical protein
MTLLLAALVLVSSSAGIFVNGMYVRETPSWALLAIAQDIANVVAVVVLLTAVYFVSRESVRGVLVWIGVILFLIYAFVIYTFDVHFNSLFLLYVAILGLSVYTFLGGAMRLDLDALKNHLPAKTKVRPAVSVFLMLSALLFYFLWLSEDVPALLAGSVPASATEAVLPTNPVHVLDLGIYLPAIIIASVSLWRRKALGYAFAVPLLVFITLTGFGILIMDSLLSAAGVPVSSGQEAFVVALVAVSLVLSWLYLRMVKDTVIPDDVVRAYG